MTDPLSSNQETDDDLAEWLRNIAKHFGDERFSQCGDELDRQRAEIEKLTKERDEYRQDAERLYAALMERPSVETPSGPENGTTDHG